MPGGGRRNRERRGRGSARPRRRRLVRHLRLERQALDELGALRLDAAPAPPVHAAPDMVPVRLPRRYTSRIYKHLDAIRAAAAWHIATETEREALLATGGRGAGALWMQLRTGRATCSARPISELRRY